MKQNASSMTRDLPLSITQQRMWVLEQLRSGSAVQNVALGLYLNVPVDQQMLEKALACVMQRHEILRTEFHVVNGEPAPAVLAAVRVPVKKMEMHNVQQAERDAQLSSLAQQEAMTPFELSRAPLLRALWIPLSSMESAVVLAAHRMICDEASLHILLAEIKDYCEALLSGRTAEQEKIPRQYSEFPRETPSAAALSYWTTLLAGAPESVDLPTNRPRPPVPTFRCGNHQFTLAAPLVHQLRCLGGSQGNALFSTLLALFNVVLFRYSTQEDVVVGVRISDRDRQRQLRQVIGPLENLCPLRLDMEGDPTFSDLLKQMYRVWDETFLHEQVPFESLVRELHLDRDMSRHPLFQIVLAMDDFDERADLEPNLRFFEVTTRTEPFDLSLKFVLKDSAIEARLSYSTDLFDAPIIERMAGHYRQLLESALENPNIPISRMPLLSAAERHKILVEWNDTQVAYPRDIPLHRLIEQQVKKTPDAIAVIYESEKLTYRELNDRANQLARYLQTQGVGPDVLVGVCAERSIEMVIALLASLKAGGAYVPLDPEYPKDRLETMLQDAQPPVVLTQAHLLDRLPEETSGIFCLDRDWPSLQSLNVESIQPSVGGNNLAYAIYTSGSTGKPKGVPNVHRGIVNRLLWMQDTYRLTNDDRVLQKTPFSFDVSVWEFFWPLMAGATLVVARPGGHRDPTYLVNLIAERCISTLHFVPSMLSVFLESDGLERCRSVRQVFASGEALPYELQQRFFARMQAELHNLYGPTEAAVDVTYWHCRSDSQHSIVPIGRPIANTQIYILDRHLQPVPIGVAGELHIGGIGLARGYLNRPELTAEKFIPDPFSQDADARLYKTGDLARFLPDGSIEYLGRMDFQVKLRGFRIELGEIEAALGQCPGVLQAVVVVREDSPGDKRLVAYLLVASQQVEIENLRKDLKDRLPEYMVPSRFIFVDRFPMTTSGKVDRKGLPAPSPEQHGPTGMTAPRNELEAKLTSLFASVLGLPSIGVTDNFFDLGGHSLLAARLLAQVNEATGKQLPLSALFRAATVESLAGLIDGTASVERDPIVIEIQHGEGRQMPFFAIVPPGEESLGYAMLARHMGPEQTVYKIQGQTPVTGGKRPYSKIELKNLTSEYIEAMRRVQPHGPYFLGGLCDGTHIAEQIVLRLEAQGEEVALFAIFDTWVLQHSQRRWLWKIYYYGQRFREIRKLSLSDRIASYKRVAKNKVQNLTGAIPERTDWQQAYWPEGFVPPRFQAPVFLFKRPKQPFYYVNDPQMGWGARSLSGVHIHEIDFRHMEILREPHVRIFAQELVRQIKRGKAIPAVLTTTQSASSERQTA